MNKIFSDHRFYYRGRVGLYAILRALGIGPGDEVVTQAFTCVAVPEAIMSSGATPVYADVEKGGVNMDPASLKTAIGPRTKLIIVQHTFGYVADIESIARVCGEVGLPIVEDCCHTHQSELNGKKVGSFGLGAFFSYEWGKPVVLGIGGSVVANDGQLEETLEKNYSRFAEPGLKDSMRLALQGLLYKYAYTPQFYWYVRRGFRLASKLGLMKGNYNSVDAKQLPDDYSMKMLPSLLRKLSSDRAPGDSFIKSSEKISSIYNEELFYKGIVQTPSSPDGSYNVLVRYPIFVENKKRFLKVARENRIEVAGWYDSPVHPLPDDHLNKVGYRLGMCPEVEKRCRELVSLPVNPKVRDQDIERTLGLVKKGVW